MFHTDLIYPVYKSNVIISGQYKMAVIKTNPVRNQLKKVPEKLFQLQRPDGKPGRAFAPPEILWTAIWERREWCPSSWLGGKNWQRCIDKIHQLIGDWQGHHISQVLSYRNENFTSVLSFSPFGRKTALYCDYTASGRSLEFIEDFIQAEVLTKRNLYSHWQVK